MSDLNPELEQFAIRRFLHLINAVKVFGTHRYVYFLELSNGDIYVGSTDDHQDNRYDRFSNDVERLTGIRSDERPGIRAEECTCVRIGRAFERG